ncbi:hypothetical protein VTL71DRAFT_11685 [Oculimacula yallundae]|uniref:Heterokaryon incompatibility domain-containing protein n=1 Tax=Oculimacula yallundae TaxID=86028 RepID=A0ABR4CRG6_9HELO
MSSFLRVKTWAKEKTSGLTSKHEKDALCSECSQIDFGRIFQAVGNRRMYVEHPDLVLDILKKSSVEHCKLCASWKRIIHLLEKHPSLRGFTQLQLEHVGSPTRYIDFGLFANGNASLELSFSRPYSHRIRRSYHREFTSASKVKSIPPYVDTEFASQWIHAMLDENRQSEGQSAVIPRLRLIECNTRKIVQALQDVKYITLSYVWGKGSIAPVFRTCLSEELPATIEDTILFTQRLGLNYVWIDRYCIDQNDTEDVQFQCQQMSRIYNESEMTFVAASGDNPDYGLPGVKSRSRAFSEVRVQHKQALRFIVDSLELIEKSTWIQRGWTYQEAFLSRHLLYFLDSELVFQTNGQFFDEGGLYDKKLPSQARPVSTAADFDQVGHRMIYTCIKDYSIRHLTYPSDVLRAFQGLFNHLNRFKLSHLWGIPVWSSWTDWKSSAMIIEDNYTAGPNQIFLGGLSWISGDKSNRVDGFPSWSWAGWTSPVASWRLPMLPRAVGKLSQLTVQDAKVDIEMLSGELMTLVDYHQQCIDGLVLQEPSPFVHISSWTAELELVKPLVVSNRTKYEPVEQIDVSEIRSASIPTATGGQMSFEFFVDEQRLSFTRFVAILVGQYVTGDDLRDVFIICGEDGDHYERIDCAATFSRQVNSFEVPVLVKETIRLG